MIPTTSKSLLLALALSTFHQASLGVVVHRPESRTTPHPQTLLVDSLSRTCNFVLGDLSFDLCPLVHRPVRVAEDTRGSRKRSYELTLAGQEGTKRADTSGCPEGTWVCMMENNSPPEENLVSSIPIAGEEYKAGTNTKEGVEISLQQRTEGDDRSIVIRMGANRKGSTREAIIDLQCGSEDEKVDFLGARHRVHEFRWTSPQACGRAIGNAFSSPLKDAADESNDTRDQDDKKDGEGGKSPSGNKGTNDGKPEEKPSDGEKEKQPSDDKGPSKEKPPSDNKDPSKEKPSDGDKNPQGGEDGKKPSSGDEDKPSKEPSKESPKEKHPDHSRHAPTPTGDVPASRPSTAPTKDGDAEKPIPPSDDEDSDDGLNLKFPDIGSRRSVAITTLAIASFSLVTVAYLLYAPPRPVRRWLQRHLKRRRFRVGEVRLVRWANEDDDVLRMDEEDEMVNGRRGEDSEYVFDDESIPLKPSPRKYRHAHYGSASWS